MSIFWTTQSQIDEVQEKIKQLEADVRQLKETLTWYQEINDEKGQKLVIAVKKIAALCGTPKNPWLIVASRAATRGGRG